MPQLKIDHSQIKVDSAVLPRTGGDEKLVDEYAEIKRLDKDAMPPPVVFWDEAKETHWLADGCKRLRADKKLGLKQTVCEVRKGDRAKAIWFACQANLTHGTRMTSAQKRQAVGNCLADKVLCDHSDPQIAEQCGVSTSLVQNRRKALIKKISGGPKSKPRKKIRKTKSGGTMDVTNIGGKSPGRPKKPKPPTALTDPPDVAEDGLGNPVPEWLMDVWADVARINVYLTSLTDAVVTPVQRFHEAESGAGADLEPKYVAGQVNETRKHVRDSMPWSVCPKCREAGRIRKSCDRCKGRGWLTRPQQDATYAL